MTAPAEHWLAVYDRDHAHAANRLIHWVCAPAFLAGLLGILWCIPVPTTIATKLAAINWATLFAMASIVYYFIMSITLALGALIYIAGTLGGIIWLALKNGADTINVEAPAAP